MSPRQRLEQHVDHIGGLITLTRQALDQGQQAADARLAQIQQSAHRARSALRPRPGRIRPYLLTT